MNVRRRAVGWVWFCVVAALWVGCRTRPVSLEGVPVETSVRPGVNDSYLKEEMNVEEWRGRFERAGREVYDERERIVKETKIASGAVVADIGAGSGLFTMLLAEEVGEKGKVYAVDIVPEFLLYVRRRAVEKGLKNVETLLCGERSVRLPENSVDVAFLCDVYHHFEYPQSTLGSLQEALRPGGQLILVEFKRVPGQSSPWVMEHVRAGEGEFTREIEKAGFKKEKGLDFLKENYFLRFSKVED